MGFLSFYSALQYHPCLLYPRTDLIGDAVLRKGGAREGVQRFQLPQQQLGLGLKLSRLAHILGNGDA
jgi:hypothetical protein